MKKKILVVSLFLCCFLFTVNAYAVVYSYCFVTETIVNSDGTVRLVIYEGAGQDYWEGEGAARLTFDAKTPAGKIMMATILTAVSLGSEVRFTTNDWPALNPVRQVMGVALVSP